VMGVVHSYNFVSTLKWMIDVGVFTPKDIARFWNVPYKVAWDRLYRLKKGGYVDKVGNGCYAISAQGRLWMYLIELKIN